ncbi:hypothetical protein [Propionibacterium sp.]|uniref:hypothetical protein n=1 Tax=Propionibacterium sp. TaxID=1977903 RepID=UPI0039E7B4CF
MNPVRHTFLNRAEVPDQRGMSVSVLVASCLPAFVLACGLAVDGSARLSTQREAAVVAAQAARAGSDAWALSRLAGNRDTTAAIQAAQQVVAAHPAMRAEVGVQPSGRVTVNAHTTVDTQFVSLVGIDRFDVSAQASADLQPR